MTTVLLVAATLAALGFAARWWSSRDASPRETPADWQAHYERVQAARRERVAEAVAARTAYFGALAAGWPYHVACTVDGKASDLLIAADGACLMVVPGREADSFSADGAWELPIAEIAELRLEPQKRYETRKRTEQIVTPTKNTKSPVGRALVGGLLLGPLGAVVGAASGLKTPDATVTTKDVDDRIEVEGVPVLQIITRNLSKPLVKVAFPNRALTEEWTARLRGAMLSPQG